MPPMVLVSSFKAKYVPVAPPGQFSPNNFLLTMAGYVGKRYSSASLIYPVLYAAGIAVDQSGNVYTLVSGQTADAFGLSDIVLTKYENDGTVAWSLAIGTAGYDYAGSLDVDAEGNVYVAASGNGVWPGGATPSAVTDLIVAKFNTSGLNVWTNTYRATTGVAVSKVRVRGVIAIAYTQTPSRDCVLQIGLDGATVWGRADYQLNTLSNGSGGVDIDSSGNLYLSTAVGTGSTALLGRLSKYSSIGGIVWHKVISSNFSLFCCVSVDSENNIICAGASGTSNTAASATVVKFSQSGSIVWVRRLSFPSTSYLFTSICTDAENNVYAFGKITLSNTVQAIIVKYSSAGDLQYQKYITGPTCFACDGKVGQDGKVYLLMAVDEALNKTYTDPAVVENHKYTLAKFPSAGLVNGTYGRFTIADAALTVESTTFAFGSGYTFSNSGSPLVDAPRSVRFKALQASSTVVGKRFALTHLLASVPYYYIDALGNQYIAAYTRFSSSVVRWHLIKLNTLGDIVWQRQLAATYSYSNIVVDDLGYVYVSGSTSANYGRATTTKLSADGVIQWRRNVGNWSATRVVTHNEKGQMIAVDNTGAIVQLVDTYSASLGARLLYQKFASDGSLVHAFHPGNGTTQALTALGTSRSICVDSTNYVHMLAQMSSATYGTWWKSWASTDYMAMRFSKCLVNFVSGSMHIDSSDWVYLSGALFATSSADQHKVAILKYNTSGTLLWKTVLDFGASASAVSSVSDGGVLWVSTVSGIVKLDVGTGSVLATHAVAPSGKISIASSTLYLNDGESIYAFDIAKLPLFDSIQYTVDTETNVTDQALSPGNSWYFSTSVVSPDSSDSAGATSIHQDNIELGLRFDLNPLP